MCLLGPSNTSAAVIVNHHTVDELFGGEKGKRSQGGGNMGEGGVNPVVLRHQHAVKEIMYQLCLALMHMQRKNMVVRYLGWKEIMYTPGEEPLRLRFSNWLIGQAVA